MPVFFYRAYGPHGELAEGQVEAVAEQAVGEILWGRKLVPFHVEPANVVSGPWWRRRLSNSNISLSDSQLASFTREFATLSDAGIPLADALRILVDQASSVRSKRILERLYGDILNGASLSQALEKEEKSFSAEYINIIRAGETGGALAQALDELAHLLERRGELRGRIHSALVYPAILVALSILSLVVITGVLIPNIAPIFRASGATVPGTIAFLMALHDHWQMILFIIAAGCAGIAGGISLAMQSTSIRMASDQLKLKVPLAGAFLLKRDTARFARTFGTLVRAGVPLLQAANSATATTNNEALAASLKEAINRVREGASLYNALRDCTPLPTLALRMIAIGEQAANLGQMLLRIADMFEQQTQRSLDRAMVILTPAITLFIAGLVGLLIVTIMNALLSLNDIAIR